MVGEDLVEEGEELANGDLAVKGQVCESAEPLAKIVDLFIWDIRISLPVEEGFLHFEDRDDKIDLGAELLLQSLQGSVPLEVEHDGVSRSVLNIESLRRKEGKQSFEFAVFLLFEEVVVKFSESFFGEVLEVAAIAADPL